MKKAWSFIEFITFIRNLAYYMAGGLMEARRLTHKECQNIRPGEALTLATVVMVLTAALLAVVAFKLFTSNGAKLEIPGGFKFEWK